MVTLRKLSEAGDGEPELKKAERTAVSRATSADRTWWAQPKLRYPTREAEEEAIRAGKLVWVSNPNHYFAMPSYIREDWHLQYLRPSALKLLTDIMEELDKRTNFSQRGVRFAVISLYRSEKDQEEMLQGEYWYRAAPADRSSHTAGASIDISLRSHYIFDPDKNELRPVNMWDANRAKDFDPMAIETLGELVAEKAAQGLCNVVVENLVDMKEVNDYTPTCLHICVSPTWEERYNKEHAGS